MSDTEQKTELRIPEGEDLEQALSRAYRLYQGNIRQTDELIYRITKGARGNAPEAELLDLTLEALKRCRYSLED